MVSMFIKSPMLGISFWTAVGMLFSVHICVGISAHLHFYGAMFSSINSASGLKISVLKTFVLLGFSYNSRL